MLISKSDEAMSEAQEFVATLMVAMRLRRSLRKLFEAGCNLTRRMCIVIYCNKNKKVKVRLYSFARELIPYCQVEIDFGSSGLLTSKQPTNTELPKIADFLESALEEWCHHLAELRVHYPAIRFA